MKKIWVLCVAILLIPAFAQVSLASTGMGGRAMAMGGAFTAVADDGTAAYWNPAGLTQVKFVFSPTLGGVGDYSGFNDLFDKMVDFKNPSSYDSLADLNITKTEAVLNLGLGFNFSRTALNLFLDPRIYTNGMNEKEGDFNGNAPVVLALTYAQEFTDLLGVGVNLKYVGLARGAADYKISSETISYNQYSGEVNIPTGEVVYGTGTGLAMDIGGIFKVSDRVRVGAVVKNINLGGIKLTGERSITDIDKLEQQLEDMAANDPQSVIDGDMIEVPLKNEDLDESYDLPTVLVLGGAIKLPVAGTLISADYEVPLSDEDDEDDSIHVGLEQPIFGVIFLRVGGYTFDDDFRLTGGLGGKLGPVLLDLAVVEGEDTAGVFLTGGLKF